MEYDITDLKEEIILDRWSKTTVYNYLYTRQDGRTEPHYREIHDHGDGVACLLYNLEYRKFLFVQQLRLPIWLNYGKDKISTEICAGLLDQGANIEQNIKREIKEEINIEIEKLDYIFPFFPTSGAVSEQVHLFMAEYFESNLHNTIGGAAHEGEDLKIIEIDFDESLEWIKTGKMIDGKTIIAVLYFFQFILSKK